MEMTTKRPGANLLLDSLIERRTSSRAVDSIFVVVDAAAVREGRPSS
jgi:hypothetical protein